MSKCPVTDDVTGNVLRKSIMAVHTCLTFPFVAGCTLKICDKRFFADVLCDFVHKAVHASLMECSVAGCILEIFLQRTM